MFSTPLQNALLFTVQTIFSIYISIVLIRFMLQLVRAQFYNPIAQFVVKATNPILVPLRKVVPGFFGIDWASVVLALTLQSIALFLTLLIKGFTVPLSLTSISGLVIWSAGELTDICLLILLFATFILIISSWVHGNRYNDVTILCEQVTAPLFNPVRKVIPNVGMLDFSAMVVVFLIVLMRLLIADYIIYFGKSII